MREIKFRAWDKERKAFIVTPFAVMNLKETSAIFMNPNVGDKLNCCPELIISTTSNKHFLMQFTGLYDKKAKEIYEGDIIEIGHGDNKLKAKVVWSNDMSCWGVNFDGKDVEIKWYANDTWNHLNVIGNVFENPELLEEKP